MDTDWQGGIANCGLWAEFVACVPSISASKFLLRFPHALMSSLSPSQHIPWLCAPEPSQVWPSCLLWQSRLLLSGKGLPSLFFLALSYFPGLFVPVPAPPFPQGFSLFLQMVAHLLPQPQSCPICYGQDFTSPRETSLISSIHQEAASFQWLQHEMMQEA